MLSTEKSWEKVLGLVLALGIGIGNSLVWAEGPAVPAGSVAPSAPAGAAGAPQAAPGGGNMMIMMLILFAVMYFVMIRPQQKRMKQQQVMLSELKHGDEVVTTSGMLGTITGITEKVVTLEVADEVRVKMLKSQVAQVVKGQIQDLPRI